MGKHQHHYSEAVDRFAETMTHGYQPRHVKTADEIEVDRDGGYRTYLVAVVATSQDDLMDFLVASPYGPSKEEAKVDSWWIAEDDRTDRSDNDSAIFVPRGGQADFASLRDQYLEYHAEEWREDGYPYADTDVSGQWFTP